MLLTLLNGFTCMACLDELRTVVQAQQLMAHETVVAHGRKHFACAGSTYTMTALQNNTHSYFKAFDLQGLHDMGASRRETGSMQDAHRSGFHLHGLQGAFICLSASFADLQACLVLAAACVLLRLVTRGTIQFGIAMVDCLCGMLRRTTQPLTDCSSSL